MSRMDFNEQKYDEIFLLEEEYKFDKLKFKDIPSSINDIFSFIKEIYVQYEFFGKKKKKCLIKDLQNIFDFIKVIHYKKIENEEINNNKIEYNEINFLILKNKNYSDDDILQKINNKKIFEIEIKSKLNINEYPLKNYFLKEDYNFISEQVKCFYDKVYTINKNKIIEEFDNIEKSKNQVEKNIKENIKDEINKSFLELDQIFNSFLIDLKEIE